MTKDAKVPTPAQLAGVPEKRLTISPDVQIRARAVADSTAPSGYQLDVRLFRRPVEAVGADDFMPTDAGFRLPLHRASDLADALVRVAERAGAAAVFAPSSAP